MCLISIIMWVRRLRQMDLNFADHCCRVSEMGRKNKFIRYTHKHIYIDTHSHTYIYTYISVYTHAHIHIYTDTYIHKETHIHIHTYMITPI